MKCLKIHCDGGARGNPGPAACAFVVYDDQGNIVDKGAKYLGIDTNNGAEYNGVLLACEYLENLSTPPDCVNFFLDSQLVVRQLMREYKIKSPSLARLADIIRKKTILFTTTFHHVPRSQNVDADNMVNWCMDENVNG